MHLRTVILLVVFALLAIFAALNWGAFMAPASLSLGFTVVQAPLGFVLLGFVAFLSALFLAFVVYLQGTVLMDNHRSARELQAQRELAEKAEASRLAELRGYLAGEIDRIHQRIDKLDHDFGEAFERNEASMAAYIGELGERVDRQAAAGELPAHRPGSP